MRIFISYSRQDFPHVEALYDELNRAGHEPWMDTRNIQRGDNWEKSIKTAIESTELFLMIVSPWSLSSNAVRGEWEHALNCKKQILLLVVQSIRKEQKHNLPDGLPWIDIRSCPYQAVKKVLKWMRNPKTAMIKILPVKKWGLIDTAPITIHYVVFLTIISAVTGIIISVDLIIWLLSTMINGDSGILYIILILFLFFSIYYYLKALYTCILTYTRETNNLFEDSGAVIGLLLTDFIFSGLTLFIVPFMLLVTVGNIYEIDLTKFILQFQDIRTFLFINVWINPKIRDMVLFFGVFVLSFFLYTFIYLASRQRITRWLPAFSRRRTVNHFERCIANQTVELAEPAHNVTILFSQADTPYAERLGRLLVSKGFEIKAGDEFETNTDVAVAVISSWFMEDTCILKMLHEYAIKKIPIVPVILENFPTRIPIPPEISRLNFIDSRIDLEQAEISIVAVLSRTPDTSQPLSPERLFTADLKKEGGDFLPDSNDPLPLDIHKMTIDLWGPTGLKTLVFALLLLEAQAAQIIHPLSVIGVGYCGYFMILGVIQFVIAGALLKRAISVKKFLILNTTISISSLIYSISLLGVVWILLDEFILGYCVAALFFISEVVFTPINTYRILKSKSRAWLIGGSQTSLSRIPKFYWIFPCIFLLVWLVFQVILKVT